MIDIGDVFPDLIDENLSRAGLSFGAAGRKPGLSGVFQFFTAAGRVNDRLNLFTDIHSSSRLSEEILKS